MVRPPCKWLKKNRTYPLPLYCKNPKLPSRTMTDDDYCLGCSVYEPKEVTPPMKVLHCKYQSETSDKCQKLPNCNVYPCVFEVANEWDAAKVRCKYFERHDTSILRDILHNIPESDLTFLESMLKDDAPWTMKQISLSLSGRNDP